MRQRFLRVAEFRPDGRRDEGRHEAAGVDQVLGETEERLGVPARVRRVEDLPVAERRARAESVRTSAIRDPGGHAPRLALDGLGADGSQPLIRLDPASVFECQVSREVAYAAVTSCGCQAAGGWRQVVDGCMELLVDMSWRCGREQVLLQVPRVQSARRRTNGQHPRQATEAHLSQL